VVGSEPDGDSVHFTPDNPDAFTTLHIAARLGPGGRVQLRFDAIDALETHYTPTGHGQHPHHQPLDGLGTVGRRRPRGCDTQNLLECNGKTQNPGMKVVLSQFRLRPAARRTPAARHPRRYPRVELLHAGGPGHPLVPGRHPGRSAGGRQRDRSLHRLRLPARGCRRTGRPGTEPGSGAARSEDGRLRPRQHRRDLDRDRPVPHPGPHPRGGSVVVRETRQPRREHPGDHRPGRLAAVDLTGTPRPRTRHHRAARTHPDAAPPARWTEDHLRVLGDLGYEGEADTITVAFKKPKGGELTHVQKTYNKVHNGIRAVGERGNSLLKTTFKALRNVSLCPGRSATSPQPP
jgi:hypothetical protein